MAVRLRLPDTTATDTRFLAAWERLVVVFHPHWAWAARDAIAWGGGIGTALWWALGENVTAGITVGACLMIASTVRWYRTSIMVTDKRVLLIWGVFSRRVTSWPLSAGAFRCTYSRGVFGVLLGFGTIGFYPPQRSQRMTLRYVPRPDRIYLTFADMLFARSLWTDDD